MGRLNFEDIDFAIDQKQHGGSADNKKVEPIDNLEKSGGGNKTEEEAPVRKIENVNSSDVDEDPAAADVFDPADYIDHETVSSGSVKERTIRSGRKITTDSGTANMRLPRSLLSIIKSEFPAASNQDALAAYILVKSGSDVSVSPSVDALVESYEGDRTMYNLDKRVEHIEKQVNDMRNVLGELRLGLSYIILDRVGFRNENPADPRDINFLENGIDDLQSRLSEQAAQLKQHQGYKKGRPIR